MWGPNDGLGEDGKEKCNGKEHMKEMTRLLFHGKAEHNNYIICVRHA